MYKKKIHNLDKQAPLNQFSSQLQKDRPHLLSHSLCILESRKLVHYNYSISFTNSHIKSPLRVATSICSNISSVNLLHLSFRISSAVQKASSMPADVVGMIKCDSCMGCITNGALDFDDKIAT